MRILYLTPLVPSTSASGGRRAVFNHLADLRRSAHTVDLACVDVEAETAVAPRVPVRGAVTVLRRSIPRIETLTGKCLGVLQLLTSPLPRSAYVVCSRQGRGFVGRALRAARYDLVVVDHLSAWSLLRGRHLDTPVCYIAHNAETDIVLQQMAQPGVGRAERLRLRIEAAKIARFEQEVLERSDRIVAIASTDLEATRLAPYRAKATVWPELPLVKAARWSGSPGGHLLFVGAARYHPNADAIDWLVTEFMPSLRRLLPGTTLRIAGTAASDVPHLAAISTDVIFEGFVDDARLDELHVTARLFVSPVILGSGIKIKVLEAASYGVPVAATLESLQGIDFLHGPALVLSREASKAAAAVAALLADPVRLERSSARATDNLRSAIGHRPPLAQVLEQMTARATESP